MFSLALKSVQSATIVSSESPKVVVERKFGGSTLGSFKTIHCKIAEKSGGFSWEVGNILDWEVEFTLKIIKGLLKGMCRAMISHRHFPSHAWSKHSWQQYDDSTLTKHILLWSTLPQEQERYLPNWGRFVIFWLAMTYPWIYARIQVSNNWTSSPGSFSDRSRSRKASQAVPQVDLPNSVFFRRGTETPKKNDQWMKDIFLRHIYNTYICIIYESVTIQCNHALFF